MGKAGLSHCAGHSPNGAGGFVLGENDATLIANQARAGKTIGAHAGEDDGEHTRAVDAGRAAKECVNCRPAMILGRVLVEVKGGRCARPGGGYDFHMPVAARDEDRSGSGLLTFGRLADAKLAAPIQPLGKQPGEDFGHVLHHENRQ